MSHVTGYPARSRDRSRDRHTVTATRPQPPSAGSRAGSCAGSCDESCARLCRHLWPWELTKALGPRALSAAFGPLAPTVTPSLWPVATPSSWPTPFVNHGRWRPSSLGGPWRLWRPQPLAASNLRRPLAHRAPLATIGYQGVVVIRNGRVIKLIVKSGGHSGLGGMSWWCGGMSWKVVREKGEGSWGNVRSRCHGLTYPPREGPARGIAPSTSTRGPRALLPRISVSIMAAW